uniref:WH2 domain-containing protein n=1 Tax=Soboliphyme baturini TaxID=241478 RepID=A0A183IL28_9BILA
LEGWSIQSVKVLSEECNDSVRRIIEQFFQPVAESTEQVAARKEIVKDWLQRSAVQFQEVGNDIVIFHGVLKITPPYTLDSLESQNAVVLARVEEACIEEVIRGKFSLQMDTFELTLVSTDVGREEALLQIADAVEKYITKPHSLKEQKSFSGKRSESSQKVATATTSDFKEAPVALVKQGTVEIAGPPLDYADKFLPVPSFNVPDVLPDLPGGALAERSLAVDKDKNEESCQKSTSAEQNTAVPESASVMPSLAVPEKSFSAESAPSLLSVPPPPPPPNVPPPSLDSPLPNFLSANVSVQKTAGNTRADLMAAIRKAGGAEKFSFRSVADEKRRKKLEKNKADEFRKDIASKVGSNSIMDDLKTALENRRKGITGRLQGNSTEKRNTPDEVMKRLADSFPTPECTVLNDLEIPEDDWNS